ncbi:hypothetical protein F5Y05DRAFT_417324 [Hypoxylon sp. FL0543]|nr:hypothetical protein F5Y05DRAFT_417324 [Hypoxylon sp. FL0543]
MMSPGQYELDEDSYANLLPVINISPAQNSPLLALSEKVEALFQGGPDAAFCAFQNLQQGITESTYKRDGSRVNIAVTSDFGPLPKIFNADLNPFSFWESAKMASTLVLLFACSNDAETMYAVVQGRTFGGHPSYKSVIQNTPSASFPLAFKRAKSAALDAGQTTVMVVTLHDVHNLELDERQEHEPEEDVPLYYDFSHHFTVGIGPEGIMIWQVTGPEGRYRLDEYIRDGHARLRSWGEAEQFVRDFDELASQEGPWTAHIKELYKKLFFVDIGEVCGPNGPEFPVYPRFKAWVRIHTAEDVTYENVTKFRWVK